MGVLLIFVAMLNGCGGSGSGGTGIISSSGSLALSVDKTTAAAGTDSLTATVTLTSLLSQPVNGVSVSVDITSNGVLVASASSNTNSNGVAVITLPVAMVESDRTYYLQARSTGVTPSSSVAVTVKAPVLSTTIPVTTEGSVVTGSTLQFVLSNDTVSFKDGLGNPLQPTNITFTLNSQTDSSGALLHNGTVLNATSNPSFIVTTDATGNANTGLTALVASGAADTKNIVTFYYTLSATYAGKLFTKQLSTQFTVTATAPPE